MNTTWPADGNKPTCRYQHNLGLHLVALFSEFKSNLLHLQSEGRLQTCLKKLIEFCKHVILNKDILKNSFSKSYVSKSLSAIKSASLQLSQLVKQWPPMLTSTEYSFENQIKLVDDIIAAIQAILKTFYRYWKNKFTSSVKNMDSLWNTFTQDEDTLYFEFDRYKTAYENDKFFSATKQSFLPLEGDYADYFDAMPPYKNFKPSPFTFDRVSLAKHKSKVLSRTPKMFSGGNCMEMINNGTELIETAHKVLLESQKVVYTPSKNIDRNKMKNLRRKLNQAIINFDVSTTSFIEDMDNVYRKEDFLKNGSNLLELVRDLDNYMEEETIKFPEKTSEEPVTKTQSPIISPRSCKSEDSKLSFSLKSMSPRSTDFLSDEEVMEDLKDLSNLSPGHPINAMCFEEIAKRIIEAATTKDGIVFEREINKITDCQNAMKSFLEDQRKRKELKVMVAPLLEKAVKTSREFIKHCRKLRRRATCTGDELNEVKDISRLWCKNQVCFIDSYWKMMSPWTTLMEPIFAIKQFHSAPSYLQNTLSNEWTQKFQELNSMLQDLSAQFDCMLLDNPAFLNHHQQRDPFLRSTTVGNQRTESQIKVQNLTLELKEYATKVLQLTKLFLLGDIEQHEWLSFGLWLFRWANACQNILWQIDTSIHVYSGHGFSMKRLMKEHAKWMGYAERLRMSSQDTGLLSSLEKRVRESNRKFDRFKETFDHSTDTIDIKKARLVILLEEWKMKTHELAKELQSGTAYLSKPIQTLTQLSSHHASYQLPESFSFEEYEEIFLRKMERVRLHTCLAVDKATERKSVHTIIELLNELEGTSDKLLNICRKEQTESLTCQMSTVLFNHQVEWQSHGNYIVYLLRKLPDVNFSAVSAVMRHLTTHKDMSNPHEFLQINQQEHLTEKQEDFNQWLLYRNHNDKNNNEVEADSVYGTWADDDDSLDDATNGLQRKMSVGEENTKDQDETEEAMRQWLREETLKSSTHVEDDTQLMTKKEKKIKPPVSPKPKHYKKILQDRRVQSSTPHKSDESQKFRPESRPKSLAAAARILQAETDKWEEDNNSIIKVAKLMASQMSQMADFEKGRGILKTKTDFVATAKAIAANAKTIAKFATIVAEQCPDESCQTDLLHYAELIPTISTQLRIVASVKSINNNDETADTMLVINAGNLMKGVIGALKSAEAASVKISTMPVFDPRYDDNFYFDGENESDDVRQSCDLTFQWKRKVRLKRAVDALCTPRDELGLRLSKETSLPSLTDLVLNSPDEI